VAATPPRARGKRSRFASTRAPPTRNASALQNYNAATGDGNDVSNSNPFYHWGALLGLVGLLEDGLW